MRVTLADLSFLPKQKTRKKKEKKDQPADPSSQITARRNLYSCSLISCKTKIWGHNDRCNIYNFVLLSITFHHYRSLECSKGDLPCVSVSPATTF